MENIHFSLQSVLNEIISRMESSGSFDQDSYNNFIDEVLEEKLGNGELDPDENIKNYSESLQLMWPRAEALISKTDEGMSPDAQPGDLDIADVAQEEDRKEPDDGD